MAISLLFIVLRIPIWPRLAKYRATSRARCATCIFGCLVPCFQHKKNIQSVCPSTKIGRITPSHSKKTFSRVLRRSPETKALKYGLLTSAYLITAHGEIGLVPAFQ